MRPPRPGRRVWPRGCRSALRLCRPGLLRLDDVLGSRLANLAQTNLRARLPGGLGGYLSHLVVRPVGAVVDDCEFDAAHVDSLALKEKDWEIRPIPWRGNSPLANSGPAASQGSRPALARVPLRGSDIVVTREGVANAGPAWCPGARRAGAAAGAIYLNPRCGWPAPKRRLAGNWHRSHPIRAAGRDSVVAHPPCKADVQH
jgi:hypothetical protein